MKRRTVRVGLAAVVLSVALVATGIGPSLVGRLFTSSCTMGLEGTAVSVQITGPRARVGCIGWSITTTYDKPWYLYQDGTTPGGAVICQTDPKGDGNIYTVRDAGALTAYGAAICAGL